MPSPSGLEGRLLDGLIRVEAADRAGTGGSAVVLTTRGCGLPADAIYPPVRTAP